ncbi:Lrp/AsnC family transcriptional regulator [soil metagenome]
MTASLYQHLDATDRAIVDALRRDGRRPYREIARELGVSESKVRKRVHRLLDDGWMRILAISDPLALGVPVLATTYAKVAPAALEAVTDRLARYDAVRYVGIGVGSHNVVVESLHASNGELHAFLQEALGMEGIISNETMQVVKIKKSVWDWDIRTDDATAPAPAPIRTPDPRRSP